MLSGPRALFELTFMKDPLTSAPLPTKRLFFVGWGRMNVEAVKLIWEQHGGLNTDYDFIVNSTLS